MENPLNRNNYHFLSLYARRENHLKNCTIFLRSPCNNYSPLLKTHFCKKGHNYVLETKKTFIQHVPLQFNVD